MEKTQIENDSANVIIQNRTYSCPGCKCVFATEIDLKLHLQAFKTRNHQEEFTKTHRKIEHSGIGEDYDAGEDSTGTNSQNWIKSKYGDPCELLLVGSDPKLAQACRGAGAISMGNYTYELSSNEKWIIRKRKETC